MWRRLAHILLACAAFAATGCAALVGSATSRLASDLQSALLDHDDPPTVRDGAPAFLLVLDGLIEGEPESQELLLTGAGLYGTYATAFATDPDRVQRLTARSYGYARRALCQLDRGPCAALDKPFDEFEPSLAEVGAGDVDVLYGFGSAWAGWLQARASDWSAIAEVPKVEALMRRVLELDETHAEGGAHLYMGVLSTLRPKSLGGQPEVGRRHFERAIEISKGRNLMAQVLFASRYARLVFDRELHDRLLVEVLAADPRVEGWTLSNLLAQEEASRLLESADDYF